jgi:hypothetical protein
LGLFWNFHSSRSIQGRMLIHESLLIRTARLLQASRELVLESEVGRSSDRRRLEHTALAVDESRVMIAESDKLILNSRTDRFLEESH